MSYVCISSRFSWMKFNLEGTERSPLRHFCDKFLHQRSWIYKTIYRIHPWGLTVGKWMEMMFEKTSILSLFGKGYPPIQPDFFRGELLELFLCVFLPTKSSYWTKFSSKITSIVADDFYSSKITNLSHQFVPQFASRDSVTVSSLG